MFWKCVKTFIGGVAGIGADMLINLVAGKLVGDSDSNRFEKVLMGVGSAALGGLAAHAVDSYISDELDELESMFHRDDVSEEE